MNELSETSHTVVVRTLLSQKELHLTLQTTTTFKELRALVQSQTGLPVCLQSYSVVGDADSAESQWEKVPRNAVLELRVQQLTGGCGCPSECMGCLWYGPICVKEIGECKVACTIL